MRTSSIIKMDLTISMFYLVFVLQQFIWGAIADTNTSASDAPTIISKTEWNGAEATDELTKLSLPVGHVIICHTASLDCVNTEACKQRLLSIQAFHMSSLNYHDISYNFLIGGDGVVYEGRGWEHWPAVARGFNNDSIAVTFIGTYTKELPTDSALNAAKLLLAYGVNNNYIKSDYKLLGHRQLSATESPGNALYVEIKKWPNWSRRWN